MSQPSPRKFHDEDHGGSGADLFPLMSEAELQALADDLKRTGKLQHSIVLTEDGRLLDGRNRLDALAVRRSTTPVGVLSSHGSASH
jgi:hypothetical protein